MQRYKAFLKVVEVGSFTKAAELLGYTQPALSQMMSSLERELSMKFIIPLPLRHPSDAGGGRAVPVC